MSDVNRQQEFLLLSRFNARDTEAFVSVYKLFFTELHLYFLFNQLCTAYSPSVQLHHRFAGGCRTGCVLFAAGK